MTQGNSPPRAPADLVPGLAATLHADSFPNGERARLKRMGVIGPPPLAFHRFLLRHVPERWQGRRMELGWRTLVSALAAQHQNPHQPEVPLGQALARCDYSEARLESLLGSEGRVLATLVWRAAIRLAGQRARCNWKDAARLLLAFDDEAREDINRKIARDYYRTATAETAIQTVE